MKKPFRIFALVLIAVSGLAFGFFHSSGYQRFHRLAEATSRQEIFVIQNATDQFVLDRHRPPKSLQESVEIHYLNWPPEEFAPEASEMDGSPIVGDPGVNAKPIGPTTNVVPSILDLYGYLPTLLSVSGKTSLKNPKSRLPINRLVRRSL